MLRVLIHFTHLPEPAVLDQPLSDFPSFTIAITSATAAIVN